jgi:hypothetical protein
VSEETTERQMTDEEVAQARIAELAAQIKDEKQLRNILLKAQLHLRKPVYLMYLPYLTFKPREFRKLMRHEH